MLKFRRIEISNFVCFDKIAIEPSTDPEKPLTVVRAENGSGKTTLLRAIRWGMYGERGLPSPSHSFSLHPAWWTPDSDGISTVVSIEFETDGSDRSNNTNNSKNTVYQLERSITTIGKTASSRNEPDFRRINEQTQLMIRESDGIWKLHTAGVDAVVGQLLPWDLRDFFVMDADKVADYVGGGENKILHRKEVIEKTTAAVKGLLGIDVFKKARSRVEGIGRDFGKQATKAVGDASLDDLQSELEQLRFERDDLEKEIAKQSIIRDELEDSLSERNIELEIELKGIGAAEELSSRLAKNRDLHKRLIDRRKVVVSQLAGQVEATELQATLTYPYIFKTYEFLKPLYDSGQIPAQHLHYVRSLLKSGVCVCGQDISHKNEYRNHILEQISKSKGEDRANYLGRIFDVAKSLMEFAPADFWNEQCEDLKKEIVNLVSDMSNLETDNKDIQMKLDIIDEEKIQLLRNEIDSLKSQVENVNRRLVGDQNRLPGLNDIIDSLAKKIGQRQRNERAARDKREAEAVARIIVGILDESYNAIQSEQVSHLSTRMDELFSEMTHNVNSKDLDHKPDKADVLMISQVGIKSINDRPESFEIFAQNHRGRNMPPIEINGASRRVLALSFVLALCVESKTFAPLVADSLLNFMSGTVRQNTLLVTSQVSNQPILLLTGADLESRSEVDIVDRYAGATYTLTAQWHALNAGHGGDVMRRNDPRLVSLICCCGPREYCDICERVGWAKLLDWRKRETKGYLP